MSAVTGTSGETSIGSLGEYRLDIQSITLIKPNGESADISQMLIELNIYQSIFQPVMKADLLLYDAVSLHKNFPLIGEETIEIAYKTTDQGTTNSRNEVGSENDDVSRLVFCIDRVSKQQISDKATESAYLLLLYSVEMLTSVKKRVQSAYNSSYGDAINNLLQNELNIGDNGKSLKGMTDQDQPEKSRGSYRFIVPNLKPIDALMWMNKRAVPIDSDNFYYVFFERFDGFYFNTIQQMVKYQKEQTQRANGDENYPRYIKKYYYIPSYNEHSKAKYNLPVNAQQRILTYLSINKRYSTFEKIIGGFFENEYCQIDLYNKDISYTQTEAGKTKPRVSIEDNHFNSEDFISRFLTKDSSKGTKTKIRYTLTQDTGDYPTAPNFSQIKFGEALRVQTAFSQINITVSAIGDSRVQAGDVIDITMPSGEGFTEGEDEDKYIKGKYLITDIKHLVRPAGDYTMVMNLSRDSFATELDKQQTFSPATSAAVTNPGRDN
jgi:hypothetical protein